MPKMKTFAGNKINAAGNDLKHCGKCGKCCLPAFSPFPTMLFKCLFLRAIESLDCAVKGSSAVVRPCLFHNYGVTDRKRTSL